VIQASSWKEQELLDKRLAELEAQKASEWGLLALSLRRNQQPMKYISVVSS